MYNQDPNQSALTQALGAAQYGQQAAQPQPITLATLGGSLSNNQAASTLGGTGMQGRPGNPLTTPMGLGGGGGTPSQQGAQAVGTQPQPMDMGAIQNIIKANSQPVQYTGMGGLDADSLHKNFLSGLDQLQAHFLKLIAGRGQQGQQQQ